MSNICEKMVEHPEHYNQYSVEVIELIRDMRFETGNALKYILRAPFKGRWEEDLEKAIWYLNDMSNQGHVDFSLSKKQRKLLEEVFIPETPPGNRRYALMAFLSAGPARVIKHALEAIYDGGEKNV